ncbi:hypothetical protein ACNRQA_004323 [Citrobacter koseri]
MKNTFNKMDSMYISANSIKYPEPYKRYYASDAMFFYKNINTLFGVEKYNRSGDQTYVDQSSNGKHSDQDSGMSNVNEGSGVVENKSLLILRKKNAILDCLKGDEYVEGETSKTVILLEAIHLREKELFGQIFQEVWLHLFTQQSYELRKFINMSSSIKYNWLNDKADALILSACSHKDIYVNEAAIRAVESWEQTKHAAYLNNLKKFEVKWLEDYKNAVLAELE